MDAPKQRPGASRVFSGNDHRFPAQGALLLIALLTIFLAGGPHEGAMGIFLVVAGAVLLFVPLHRALAGWLFGLAFCFIAAASLALFPEPWLGLPRQWSYLLRGVSEVIPGFIAPESVSADPQNTLFWILILSSSILTGLYCLGSPPTSRQLKSLALLSCLGCALYAVVAMIAWTTGWNYPFFDKEPGLQPAFGFFPNRNHTAGFLLTGAILSLGLMRCEISSGRILSSLIASCSCVLLTGSILFFSVSRGGLFFLLVGIAIWVLGLGQYRTYSMIAFGGFFFVMMAISFLRSENGLMDRLRDEAPRAHLDSLARAGGRFPIQRDTISMIADRPVSGTGLGTYALMYPFYAKRSLRGDATALHPESDWLALCAEGGIPALLIAFSALGMLGARIPRLAAHSGHEWPVRWAFIAAFFAEVLHGLVDVPLHRPELGWWVMLLGGIGFSGCAEAGGNHTLLLRLQRGILIVAGAATMIPGGLLIWAEWGGGLQLPPFDPMAVEKELVNLSIKGDEASLKEAVIRCEQAISDHPLQHFFYFRLAILFIQLDKLEHLYQHDDASRYDSTQESKVVEALFAVERRLSPNDPSFVFEQGELLADADPEAAAAIWGEALRRRLVLDRNPNCGIPRSSDLFGSMISEAQGHPALFAKLPGLAMNASPELRMLWLARPECDPALIVASVKDRSFMNALNARQQGQVIELWWQHHGRSKDIDEFLSQHPEYAGPAVATRASLLASSGHAKEACLLLMQTFHLPMLEAAGKGIGSADTDVPEDSLAAARYYLLRGNNVAARRLLSEALRGDDGEVDREQALFLEAILEMRDGNWPAALDLLSQFLRAGGRL
jgi:O-antigen ligase